MDWSKKVIGELGAEAKHVVSKELKMILTLLCNQCEKTPDGTSKLINKAASNAGMKIDSCSMKNLKTYYEHCVTALDREQKAKEKGHRTTHERIFENEVLLRSLNRRFISSFWIGNSQVDFFVPDICRPGMCGLAIEIDGGVHFTRVKSKKDAWKEKYLHSLRIGTDRIRNRDTLRAIVEKRIASLNHEPRPDSRSKMNMWQRIYIDTIVSTAWPNQLYEWFGLTEDAISHFKKLGSFKTMAKKPRFTCL